MLIKTALPWLLVLLLAAPASAQDVLGFYFDPGGTVDRATTTGPAQLVTGYLVLREPSRPAGVDSWECVVRFATDGPAPVATWYLEGQALNALEAPSFIVGLGSPLPAADAVVLASVSIGILGDGQKVDVHVLPHDPPSLQDPPGYGYPVHSPLYGSVSEIIPLGSSTLAPARRSSPNVSSCSTFTPTVSNTSSVASLICSTCAWESTSSKSMSPSGCYWSSALPPKHRTAPSTVAR